MVVVVVMGIWRGGGDVLWWWYGWGGGDEKTRKMTVNEGGLGVPSVNTFWKAIRMSWLRRSIGSDSTWVKLHQQEVFPYAFDPTKSNFETLNKAKAKCKNPFWKEIYSSLIECRL